MINSFCVVLLITTILPAEYGFDPTGIGKVLGLNKMGKIKASLKKDIQEEPSQITEITSIEDPVPSGETIGIEAQKNQPMRSDSIILELKTGTRSRGEGIDAARTNGEIRLVYRRRCCQL